MHSWPRWLLVSLLALVLMVFFFLGGYGVHLWNQRDRAQDALAEAARQIEALHQKLEDPPVSEKERLALDQVERLKAQVQDLEQEGRELRGSYQVLEEERFRLAEALRERTDPSSQPATSPSTGLFDSQAGSVLGPEALPKEVLTPTEREAEPGLEPRPELGSDATPETEMKTQAEAASKLDPPTEPSGAKIQIERVRPGEPLPEASSVPAPRPEQDPKKILAPPKKRVTRKGPKAGEKKAGPTKEVAAHSRAAAEALRRLPPPAPESPKPAAPRPSFRARRLHRAVRGGMHTLVAAMLDRGGDPDPADEEGRTPLFYAVQGRDLGMVRILRSAGANPGAQDVHGTSPQALAKRIGFLEASPWLGGKGAGSRIQFRAEIP